MDGELAELHFIYSALLGDRSAMLAVPASHHEPKKQSTGLFFFTVRA